MATYYDGKQKGEGLFNPLFNTKTQYTPYLQGLWERHR